METPLDLNAGRRAATFAIAALVTMLALGALGAGADAMPSGAQAKKKKKPKNPATTVSVPVSFGSATSVTGTATCPPKTHATGGGFSVSPGFTPPSTGLRSLNSTSYPSGGRGWVAAGSAYATPSAAGQFTTFARCERNTAGRIAIRASNQLTLQPGAGQSMVFNCPPSAHAISGGYAGPSLAAFPYDLANHRIVVVQNRRTGTGQWTVSAFNNPNSPAPASLTGHVVCEANAKGSSVSEAASAPAPIVDDGRTAADATCAGKTHSVSGGFLVSHTFPGAVPLVALDETQPVGKKSWHSGIAEYPGVILPAGSTLQTFVYCKKG